MTKKYYIWKDPTCGGTNIAWKEITGREFYALVRQPENRDRRFIRLGNDVCPEADIIVLEATPEKYTAWKREQNTRDYLRRLRRGSLTTSLDLPPQESELDSLYEAVADKQIDVERAALSHLAHETLEQALESLKTDDVRLLVDLYVKERSAAEIAREQGVHRSTITRRISAVLEQLKKFFENLRNNFVLRQQWRV